MTTVSCTPLIAYWEGAYTTVHYTALIATCLLSYLWRFVACTQYMNPGVFILIPYAESLKPAF